MEYRDDEVIRLHEELKQICLSIIEENRAFTHQENERLEFIWNVLEVEIKRRKKSGEKSVEELSGFKPIHDPNGELISESRRFPLEREEWEFLEIIYLLSEVENNKEVSQNQIVKTLNEYFKSDWKWNKHYASECIKYCRDHGYIESRKVVYDGGDHGSVFEKFAISLTQKGKDRRIILHDAFTRLDSNNSVIQ